MSTQTLLTPSIITKDTLIILQNNLVTASKVNRKFENEFVKIGATLTIRKPNRFLVTFGPGLNVQNISEPSTSITISTQIHVDFQFTSQDLTLTVEEFRERYVKPAAETLVSAVDYAVLTNFQNVFNEVGTPGTLPATFADICNVGERADEGAFPQNGRVIVLGPKAYWNILPALGAYYVKSVAEPALKGFIANIANFEFYMDQNIQAQTVGNYGGTPLVNGALQTGSSLVTNGWTASVANLGNIGDTFVIAGVFAVNPQNRQSTGTLQNFALTAPAASDSGGNATLQVTPSIVTSGPYQNVSVAPANLAAIRGISGNAGFSGNANGTYFQNVAFVKDTFGLVMVPLEVPSGQDFAARETWRGMSMRIWRAADINNDVFPCRIDMLFGTATYYPELGIRLTN